MKSIKEIISDIKKRNFELTQHAFIRALQRNIDIEKIISNANTFQIIEDYPEDKYSHSCLLLGYLDEEPVHLQVSRKKDVILKIITIYEPDSESWFKDYKRRRK